MKFDFNNPCPTPMTVKECHTVLRELWQECQLKQTTIDALNERVTTNSTNSSTPPSHDSLRNRCQRTQKHEAKKQTSLFFLTKRKQGAQPGHKGYGRALWDESKIDEFVPCYPEPVCFQCQEGVIEGAKLTQRKQVLDIKNGRLFAYEYQLYTGRCSCCRRKQRGTLPMGTPPGLLSAAAHGKISSLTGKYKLSKREARELLIDFYGLTVSVGTISNTERTIGNATCKPVNEVGDAIQQETHDPKNCDETSHFNHHKLMWLWLATTSHLTYFRIFEHRNQEAAQTLIGAEAKGIYVTDRYGAYSWISKEKRQFCWSHLARDFQKIRERANPEEKKIGYYLLHYTKMIFSYTHHIHTHPCDAGDYKRYLLDVIWHVSRCLKAGAKLTGTKTRTVCIKLMKEWKSLWLFVKNPLVSATNNHAERKLRHAVLWRKKSFGTQSDRGMRYVERILTCVMTCKQQNKNVANFVSDCVTAYWSNGVYPSLVKEIADSG